MEIADEIINNILLIEQFKEQIKLIDEKLTEGNFPSEDVEAEARRKRFLNEGNIDQVKDTMRMLTVQYLQ